MRDSDPVLLFLESVSFFEAEIQRRKQRADELQAACARMTANMSGMPKGRGSDQDGLLAAYADARTKELDAVKRAEEQRERVEALIAEIEPAIYREILTLRYISCHGWRAVQKKLREAGRYYSDRHIYRLHDKALAEAKKLWDKTQTCQ